MPVFSLCFSDVKRWEYPWGIGSSERKEGSSGYITGPIEGRGLNGSLNEGNRVGVGLSRRKVQRVDYRGVQEK